MKINKIYKSVVILIMLSIINIQCVENKQEQMKERENLTMKNEKMIVGAWKDSNSFVTYLENKTFVGWFGDENTRFKGTYGVFSDTLKMNFPTHQHYPKYIIEKMDSYFFEIRSLDDDAVFLKHKVQLSK